MRRTLTLSTSTTRPPSLGQHRSPLLARSIILPSMPSWTTTQISFVGNDVLRFSCFSPVCPDALSKGSLYGLDMGSLKSANSTPLAWNSVQKTPYPDGYNPVMALAQNHIHFLNVGSDGPGKARIFVIHCKPPLKGERSNSHVQSDSYFQPEVQDYPGDKTFPAAHGQTASFFMPTGVQQEFAFIPDDFSGTYIVNVENNSTRTLPPPAVQDTKSTYVAGITSLLQLDSTGAVSFVPYTAGDNNANANAAWSTVKSLAGLVASSNIRNNSTTNDQRNNNTNVPTNTQTSNSDSDGALSSHSMTSGLVGLAALFAVLGFF